MVKTRVALWDNLKLFLIFTVVLGHVVLQYFESSQMFGTMSLVIYTFHMPAFIFVSGVFSKHSINSDRFPLRRVVAFLGLYIVTRAVNYFANIIFGVHMEFSLLSCQSVAWYMLAMAIVYPITWAIRKIDPKYILILAIILGCFAGYQKENNDFLCVQRIATFFPFFYSGYILSAEKIEKVTAKKGARVFSFIFFFGFVTIVTCLFTEISWMFPLLSARRGYFALEYSSDWGGLIRGAYYIVVFLLIFSIISLCPRKEMRISKYGARTMQIYVWHRPIIYIMRNAGLFWLIHSIGPGWEWVALALTVVVFIAICPKFMGKPLNYIMNPKIKEKDYEKKC